MSVSMLDKHADTDSLPRYQNPYISTKQLLINNPGWKLRTYPYARKCTSTMKFAIGLITYHKESAVDVGGRSFIRRSPASARLNRL